MFYLLDDIVWNKEHESLADYVNRVSNLKANGEIAEPWVRVASKINQDTGLSYSDWWYRNHVRSCVDTATPYTASEVAAKISDSANAAPDETSSPVDSETHNKFKLLDQLAANRAYLRRISREDTIKEIAYHYAEIMADSHPLDLPVDFFTSDSYNKEGILLISDWHYGLEIDNPWNKYDPEICVQRINKLLEQVINKIKHEGLAYLTVLNLSDLIAGRIHTQIRIESRFDVITQTMDISEILANFLNQLSKYVNINYYDCLDNHSRVEPNKKDSMDLESLVRIIPWYLKERLKNNSNIAFHDNAFGEEIITCCVCGHNIGAAHGHNDNPVNALDKITLLTQQHFDLFCLGHNHHFTIDERPGCIVVGNSSMAGMDSYSYKYRLNSVPSQTLIIVTEDNPCEAIYRLKVT